MSKLKIKKAEEKPSYDLMVALELASKGLLDEANQRLLSILKTQPKEWRALHQLSEISLARSDSAQALKFMAAAMKANPGSADIKSNYGFILQKLERHEEALIYFNRALLTRPDYISALLNRGTSLYHLNRPAEALASFDRLLALDPSNVQALNNRANALHELNRFDECLASFAETLSRAPDYAEAHWNEALVRLLLGDFERGWKKYEWRWKSENHKHQRRDFVQPLWLGAERLAGRTILVHAEQGFGDTLQFMRYLPRLAARGAEVIFEVQPSLHRLLSGAKGASRVIARGEPLPRFDLHCPIMSLPLAFNTSLDTIPAEVPYLDAPIDRLHMWDARLPPSGKLRVAFAWAGNATHERDQLRSIPLAMLQPLLNSNDAIEWISVQRDLRAGDHEILQSNPHIRQLGLELADFSDTAAVLARADLVISVDTAVAHLAGALGRPVWLLLRYSPDFRWLLDRKDSPWYPSARLFRQDQIGQWDGVIADLATALQQLSGSR
jgi:tetratricopeptide (TPR) repeat protein